MPENTFLTYLSTDLKNVIVKAAVLQPNKEWVFTVSAPPNNFGHLFPRSPSYLQWSTTLPSSTVRNSVVYKWQEWQQQ
jgi:hypothetical protein